MKAILNLPRGLLTNVQTDLSRPHPFAFERVGFISCDVSMNGNHAELVCNAYHPVRDSYYIDDPSVGAMLGPDAFRIALQYAYNNKVSMFHIHRHEHLGRPRFSRVDLRESARFIPTFWNVQPNLPHGILLLSYDSIIGRYWSPIDKQAHSIDHISIVASPKSRLEVFV